MKSGFKLAYRNIRYAGLTGGTLPENPNIIDVSQIPFDDVDAYDRLLFPDNRSQFLKSWLNQPERVALGILQNGKLTGYGMIRPCRSGYKIGPLFADDPIIAETLFLSLKSQVKPGNPFFLDIPEKNPHAIDLVKRHQMQIIFETARMYTGIIPDLSLDKVFGVTTFELG
jgi:hypothetical protein